MKLIKNIIGDRVFLLLLGVCLAATGCDNPGDVKPEAGARPSTHVLLGPGGGGATFIPTFSPHNSDHFLLRCDMTGTYLTTDGGNSYQQMNFANGATSLAFDRLDAKVVYIGSSTLNQSVDGGKTWKPIFPKAGEMVGGSYSGDHANYRLRVADESLYDTTTGAITHIRTDPLSTNWLYFSMGRFFYYSGDGGKQWHREDCKERIDFIYTDSVFYKNEVLIFTGNHQYLFDKNDGTIGWRALPSAMQPAFSFTGGLNKENKQQVFYALHHDVKKAIDGEFGFSEIWTSVDGGKHWQQVNDSVIVNGGTGIKPSYSMIACAEQDAANVYVVTNRYQQKRGDNLLYWYGAIKSSDAGKSWSWCWRGGGGSGQYGIKDGKDADNLKDAWVEKAFGGEYIRLMDVGVSPVDGNTAIVTDWYRTMKTRDGGKTWKQIYSNPEPDSSFSSRGLEVTTTYGVHFDPFDSNHIAVSYTDIGYHHSFDGGKSWLRSVEGVPAEWVNTCYWVVFDPVVKNKLWSGWSGLHDFPRGKMTRHPQWKQRARGGICVSDNGGKTWRPLSDGMGTDAPVTSIVLDTTSPPGNRTLYAAVYNKGVFKSTDDGNHWALKNEGLDENTCAFELTLSGKGELYLTVSPTPKYTNGKTGRDILSGAVYKSVNGAAHWTKLSVREGFFFPNAIESDPLNPKRVFLSCWADIDLSDLIGGAIASSTGGNQKLKTPGGVFLSEDAGNTWKQVFDSSQYVYDVVADSRIKGRFYLNTFNKAAYRSDDNGMNWKKIKGYDFHWGQRPAIDPRNKDKIFLTTFGSSIWWGNPETE